MSPDTPPPEGVVVRRDEPLARHVPWRIGGPCDAFVVVHRPEALLDTLAWIRDQGWNRTVLGAGSRTVPRDGGLAGAVLRLGQGFVGVEADGDHAWIGAATPLAMVGEALGGPLRALLRCPGTLGASLACDPGWDGWIDTVRVVHRGSIRELPWAEVQHRTKVIFLGARIHAEGTGHAPGPELPGAWVQPVEDEDVVRMLRETALAGTRLRRVCLPEAAPELLVHLGGGSGKDVQQLLKAVVDKVHQARGIMLQEQITWIGRVS